MKEITSADLTIIEKAIKEMWPALADPEKRKELAEGVLHLAKNGSDERTRVRATMVATQMVSQGIKLGLASQEQQRQSGPSVTVNVNHVTVAPEAFTAFLEDARGALAPPKVIDGTVETPLPNELKELPAAEQGTQSG